MLAENHKRILRNTGMLYMRMLLAMAVTLYTTRVVVLAVHGVEVGAGFVAQRGFLQGAMTTATQRYFSFNLGKFNGNNLNTIFNTSTQRMPAAILPDQRLIYTCGIWVSA